MITAVGIASANTITFSAAIPTQTTPFVNDAALSNFNTAWGTLTGVNVTLSYTVTGVVNIFNTTSSTQSFSNASSTTPIFLTADGTFSSFPAGLQTSVNAVNTVGSGTIGSAAGPYGFTGSPVSGSISGNFTSSAVDFECGPGFTACSSDPTDNYETDANAGTFSGTAPNGVFFGGSATLSGAFSVTYPYTASSIPEPSTMALLGSALGGLGLLRKRLSSK